MGGSNVEEITRSQALVYLKVRFETRSLIVSNEKLLSKFDDNGPLFA